jgi:transcriptional regulator with XRE-family HTH domain
VTGDFRDSGRDGAIGEVEPALRGGGLPLPGLKRWRLRRRLSQRDLALRAELLQDHLWKIESGRRGCNPSVAQDLADLLKVDLLDLRRKYMMRRRGVLEDGGVLQDSTLLAEVRSSREAVVESYPDLDIHLLAMARRGEPTEEGHEALTKAMRDLL